MPRRGGVQVASILYCRTILQSDGEPSIVALKTATLSISPCVEVLRASPVREHATNGVAEFAMREVKRQTRTLKFALEAHVGKIVGTDDGSRCDQFLQDCERWLGGSDARF